jgi:hypothetical protein
MHRVLPYALAALPCGAAACHGPIAQVQWSYVDAPRTVDDLIVYESIQHEARVGILFRGFETRIEERLEACRVHVTVRHGQPDVDTRDGDAADAAAGPPARTGAATEHARLTIVPWGGTFTRVSSPSDEDITTRVDGSFKLELYDPRVAKVVWRAVIDVKTSSTPGISDGQDFADTVLDRLRSDHVIRCSDPARPTGD